MMKNLIKNNHNSIRICFIWPYNKVNSKKLVVETPLKLTYIYSLVIFNAYFRIFVVFSICRRCWNEMKWNKIYIEIVISNCKNPLSHINIYISKNWSFNAYNFMSQYLFVATTILLLLFKRKKKISISLFKL